MDLLPGQSVRFPLFIFGLLVLLSWELESVKSAAVGTTTTRGGSLERPVSRLYFTGTVASPGRSLPAGEAHREVQELE